MLSRTIGYLRYFIVFLLAMGKPHDSFIGFIAVILTTCILHEQTHDALMRFEGIGGEKENADSIEVRKDEHSS